MIVSPGMDQAAFTRQRPMVENWSTVLTLLTKLGVTSKEATSVVLKNASLGFLNLYRW